MSPFRILCLCTANSCRSIMLEGILNHMGKGRIEAHSAGARPSGFIHPESLATLKRHGIETSYLRSKNTTEVEGQHFDIVITLCDDVSKAPCPALEGWAAHAHWPTPDPAREKHQIEKEFENVFSQLEKRASSLLAMEFETMERDTLLRRLRLIGQRRETRWEDG